MAGIGFAIRKLLKVESLNHLVRAYAYAGIISAGPWVISVLSLTLIYLISMDQTPERKILFLQFQTSVTYLIAISLILSGILQYAYTRYIADRLFEKKERVVLANTIGLIVVTTCVTLPIGAIYAWFALTKTPLLYRILSINLLSILTNLWLISNLLSGLKCYRAILISFSVGYGVTAIGCIYGQQYGLNGMMLAFFCGQSVLLSSLLSIIIYQYFNKYLLSYDFLGKNRMYVTLMWSGFFYNAGLWIDKFLFWLSPETSEVIIGSLRASLIYDLPMYLSFFLLIPGLAVFLFRMETDFVSYYDAYYNAIRNGGNLTQIDAMHTQMVESARQGLFDIIKIQAFFTYFGFMYSDRILNFFNFPLIHVRLFQLDMLAIDLLIIFMALLNLNFYLDKRLTTLYLTLLFFVLNTLFTALTLYFGVYFYGYGLLLSLCVCNLIAILALQRTFNELTFATFMRSV